MPSDRLYEMLAQVEAQPSGAQQVLEAALGAAKNVGQGYLASKDIEEKLRKRRIQQSSLADLFGGNLPERVRPYGNLPVESLEAVSPALTAISKLDENPMAGGDYLTTEQARVYGLPEDMLSVFKGKPIKRDIAQGYLSNKSREKIGGALQLRSDIQLANSINRNVNSLTGGTGALATAGKNNLRIARVKPLLERPGPLRPEELEIVTADLSGVIQGGVPLKDVVEGQRISTVASKMAVLWSQATNQPVLFNDIGWRRRMIPLVNEMIEADNQVQNKAFNMMKAMYGHLTTPEHMNAIMEAIGENRQLPVLTPEEVASNGEIEKMSTEELRALANQAEQ